MTLVLTQLEQVGLLDTVTSLHLPLLLDLIPYPHLQAHMDTHHLIPPRTGTRGATTPIGHSSPLLMVFLLQLSLHLWINSQCLTLHPFSKRSRPQIMVPSIHLCLVVTATLGHLENNKVF